MVFPRRKKVIFIHGCFWHQHPDADCKLAHRPRSNIKYWEPKLSRNQKRDAANITLLAELGWDVMVLWECEVMAANNLTEKIRSFLDEGQTVPVASGLRR